LIVVVDLLGPRVRWWWGPGTLSGQHQPSMLPNGHVLVFDNGRSQGRSRVLKCDPPTGDIVWQYEADPPETFFTELAGGGEAVNEDRVLVTDAQAGRAFEVDRDGHIVWEMHVILPATSARRSRASVYRVSVARADGVRRVLDQAVTQTPAELGIQVAVTPTSHHRRKGSLRSSYSRTVGNRGGPADPYRRLKKRQVNGHHGPRPRTYVGTAPEPDTDLTS